MSAAGNFKDQDDAAEGQLVMNRLAELSRQTGAFVLAVDHFGKAVETGTRGTSAKEARPMSSWRGSPTDNSTERSATREWPFENFEEVRSASRRRSI